MKVYRIILAAAAAVLTMGAAASCSDKFEEITDINLTRCLQPMNLSAKVSQGQNVTVGWDVTMDAEEYILEAYLDKDCTESYESWTVAPDAVPVTITLPVDKTFWFRVQAHNSLKEDSKWAELGKGVKTFAVKDNLYMEVESRTSGSISVMWSTEAADSKDVERIEYCVNGAEDVQTYTLTAEDIAAGKAVISGLQPSTEYDIALYYSSANRGEVVAWTMPDASQLTRVSTEAALAQGMTDGAKMLLTMEGSPYTIGADVAKGIEVNKGFELYGEGDPDGKMPVVYGSISIGDSFDGGSIYCEGIAFDGKEAACGFVIEKKNGGNASDLAIKSIIFRNCSIANYAKGLFYEWGKTVKVGELTFDSCTISSINADGGNGGDGFDLRYTSSFDKLSITNCTIYNGFRTFFRNYPQTAGNDAATITELNFTNNTVMNLCFVDNSNNAGLFAFTMQPGAFNFKNNLFLNMGDKAALSSANVKYLSADNLNLSAGNNWFYGCPDTFFTSNFTLAMASGKTLKDDPCFNARAGKFNISSASEISGAKVGASKWWNEYVEAPENLELTSIEGSHTWDFSDPAYFSSDFTKAKVRDMLLVSVASNKVTVADGMLNFTAGAVTTRKGVPTDGYLAFQVNKPGSLLIKPSDAANSNGHFVIGVGPVNGGSIMVKGGAAPASDMGKAQKILVKDITEESLVYIYPTTALSLAQLAWSTDTTEVNTALPAPAPAASPETVTAGAPEDIVISWEPVENAGGYSVVFNGKTYAATEAEEGGLPSYTISSTTVGMLDPGSYRVDVYANPGKNDIYNTMSAAGTATFAVQPKGGAEEGGDASFTVKSVEELISALSAKKESITLSESGSPYVLGDETTRLVPIDYPVTIAGETEATTIEGALGFSGTIEGDVTVKNLTFNDKNTGTGCFITVPDGLQMGNLTIEDVNLIGYSKSVIYGSFDTSVMGDVVFRNITTSEFGTGQGVFDIRKGTLSTLRIIESTLVGGRDLIRLDAAVNCGEIIIRNNTIDGSNLGVNTNGILYVRGTPVTYLVANNLWLNEVMEGKSVTFSKATGITVPTMVNNFFYNVDEANFFSGMITKEIATDRNGVVLATNPVKDAASGDYTLVNGLAISNRVGASRWNLSQYAGPENAFTVKDTTEFNAAISAGKTILTLEEGEYTFHKAVNAVKDLQLIGKGNVVFDGFIDIAGDDLGTLVFDNIHFAMGNSTNGSALVVSAASAAKAIVIKNCVFDGYTKSVYYDNLGLTTSSLGMKNIRIVNQGTGQGVFDIRKGAYTAVTIEQSTITGGRDLIRADANTITGAFCFRNNTVDGSNLGVNTNGIMYVRATPADYLFKNNLFINESKDGAKVILSKATGVTVPTEASTNVFYNIDAVNFWTGLINKEVAAGIEVDHCPVKDAANGDYTLVDALVMSSNVGAVCWNPKAGRVTTDFTVNNTEELLNAIALGKSAITMNYGTYDLFGITGNDAVSEGGVLTLTQPLTLKGVKKAGLKPQIIGGIKLGEGADGLTAENIVFDGKEATVGIAVEVGGNLVNADIKFRACDFYRYSKSVFYNSTASIGSVNLFSISGCTIDGLGAGQGVIDIRKGTYNTVVIEKSTIMNGGRDFLRADAGIITNSLTIHSNTFAATGLGADNGLLWVRSTPACYTVANNVFVNETGADGTKTLLAKTGATKAVFSNNFFFNCDAANFWTGTYTQEEGIANGGAVLDTDPCTDSAVFNLKITNASVKAAKAGDPRWL